MSTLARARAMIADDARARRLVALADALDAVLAFDAAVLERDQPQVLRSAASVVAYLRRTW